MSHLHDCGTLSDKHLDRLETFNSILYHRLNGELRPMFDNVQADEEADNPNLVYAVLRSHHDFQTLATFTLVSGLRDIQRRKALRASGMQLRLAQELADRSIS